MTTSCENVPLLLEQAINGLTEGGLYALRFVCETNDWSPHLAVAGDRLFFLGINAIGRISYFDYASISNPSLLDGLKKLKVRPMAGHLIPKGVLARMD